MVQRTKRREMPADIPALLGELGACRAAMIRVCTTVTPLNPAYRAASRIIDEIDQMAGLLTGDPRHFHLKPHSTS